MGCPINASLEQLLWIYIFDAFYWFDIEGNCSKHKDSQCLKWIFRGLGWIMSLAFVGMIHALFWTEFMMDFGSDRNLEYAVFLGIQFIIIFGYIILFQLTESMFPLMIL